MKTLLLIGGTGFFGKSLTIYAQKRSLKKWKINKIINISRRRNQKLKKNNLKIINIYSDIRKIKNIPESDYIIYAANTNNNKTNLEGLKNFIKIIKKNKIKSNILFTSSGIVYGANNKDMKSKENQKTNISKFKNLTGYKKNYSKTKFLMEKSLKELSLLNFKIVIGRCYTFIGKEILNNHNYAISNFIHQAKTRKKIIVKSPNVFRSYMHANDLIEWLITMVANTKKKYAIYNVGSDQAIRLDILAKLIAQNLRCKVIIKKKTNNKKDFYVPSIHKAKKILGLKLKYNLKKSIKDIL